MGSSKVTDYMIYYIEKNGIPKEQLADELTIAEEKLRPGYAEPLLADEFLRMCVLLKIRPEDVATAIWEKNV